VLVVAALSARMLAECAALDGLPTVALDLFGDVDTCRSATRWLPIGDAAAMRIDGARLLAALESLARDDGVEGWIAGSGFEGRPDLLEQGAALLPLIGTAPDDVRRLREPRGFFDTLDRHGVAHPPVQFTPPATPAGWLHKDAGGSGGWQVRRAGDADPPAAGGYWQRERPGVPMSATFVANGGDVAVLGFNEQVVQAIGGRPFVFRGVVGPVAVGDPVRRAIAAAAGAVVGEYRLRGLGSIDFLLDGDDAGVLEVNPRPPASIALYPRVGAGGPLRAHLRACRDGELAPAPPPSQPVRGIDIVFADRTLQLDEAAAQWLARSPRTHDLPRAGSRFTAGDPVCSLSACGSTAAQVKAALARRHDEILRTLETLR
jgi:predicted ATP-grasp superfamily ATP-dependent carboligase